MKTHYIGYCIGSCTPTNYQLFFFLIYKIKNLEKHKFQRDQSKSHWSFFSCMISYMSLTTGTGTQKYILYQATHQYLSTRPVALAVEPCKEIRHYLFAFYVFNLTLVHLNSVNIGSLVRGVPFLYQVQFSEKKKIDCL